MRERVAEGGCSSGVRAGHLIGRLVVRSLASFGKIMNHRLLLMHSSV